MIALILFKRFDPSSDADRTALAVAEEAAPQSDDVLQMHEEELSDNDLRDVLSDVYSNASTLARYTRALEEPGAEAKALETQLPEIVQLLSVSQDSEHIHTAALMQSDKQMQITLLARAIAINPNDASLVWHGINECGALRDTDSCPLRDWEE